MDCRVVTVYVHSIIFAFCLTIVAALHAFAENFAKRLDNPLVFCYNTNVVFSQHESLAQAVEHLTFNQGVPGSIPGWFTNTASALLSHLWLTGRFVFSQKIKKRYPKSTSHFQ